MPGVRPKRDSLQRAHESLPDIHDEESFSVNGERVHLLANVEFPEEVRPVWEACDGIGLFRTEFLFLERGAIPDEETQFGSTVQF